LETRPIPGDVTAGGGSARVQLNLAILALVNLVSDFNDELENVEPLRLHGRGARIELAQVTQLADQNRQACARFFRLIDHPPLPLAELGRGVLLQHPEIATHY